MLWVKSLHMIFMVTWFAGVFYLPRLFVYHAMAEPTDIVGIERFKVMERKLFWGIMTPGGIFTIVFGYWMLHEYAWEIYKTAGWMHVKLSMVALLVIYHIYCGYLVKLFKNDQNRFSHVFYRWFNEVPVVILVVTVIMAIVRPF